MSKRRRANARWRVVVEYVAEMRPDDVVTYEQLLSLLDVDDVLLVQRAMSQARRALWHDYGRSLEAIPGVGYRMIRANEHAAQAAYYEHAAHRRVSDAIAVAKATHLDELTDAEREFAMRTQMALTMMAQAVQATAERTNRHAELIDGLARRVDELEAKRG